MKKLDNGERSARIPWLRVVVAIGMSLLLAVLAPLLWSAAKAGVGLLVLGLVALCGWAVIQALPYLGQRLERRLLRARLDLARRHPMEELTQQLLAREAQLARYRSGLAASAAQIAGLRDMLEERREQAPDLDTRIHARRLQRMVDFQEHHQRRLAAAEAALAEYKRHLAAKRFEWSFAQAGERVLESLEPSEREDVMRELLNDEATQAIRQELNRVFASLENAITSHEYCETVVYGLSS